MTKPLIQSRKVRRLNRLLVAVSDQGLFALGNFVTTLVVARSAGPAAYGMFLTAYVLIQFVGNVYVSTVAEPMVIFASGHYRSRMQSYLKSVRPMRTAADVVLGIAAAVVVGATAALGNWDAGVGMLAAAFVAAVGLFEQWAMRRECYALRREWVAALAGSAYLLVCVAGLLIAGSLWGLSATVALYVMGAANAVSSLLMTSILRNGHQEAVLRMQSHEVHAALRRHGEYARWAAPASVLMWVPANLPIVLASALAASESAGAVGISQTLLMPVMHSAAAAMLLLAPRLVRAKEEEGQQAFQRLVMQSAIGMTAAAATYALAVYVLRIPILEIVYGDQFSRYAPTVALACLIPVLAVPSTVLGAAVRAMERSRSLFGVYGLASTAVLVASPLLVKLGNAGQGAMLAVVAGSAAVSAGFIADALRWWTRQ